MQVYFHIDFQIVKGVNMQLIRGKRETIELATLNTKALNECDKVWVAVAYVTDDDPLIKKCYNHNIPLTLWARYDHSVPVNVSILRWFLGKAPLSECKLVPDIHHAKVIWWKPFGVYIGSANLTKSAWGSNIEAGVFLTENELDEQNMLSDLNAFFDDLNIASHKLTEEIVEEMEQFQEDERSNAGESLRKDFAKTRILPKCESLLHINNNKTAKTAKLTKFIKEWNNTLEIIRTIGKRVSLNKNRPLWINADVPPGVQADQFLHAYYYRHVIVKGKAIYRDLHIENEQNTAQVESSIIKWWRSTKEPPSDECKTIYELAPIVRDKFSQDKIDNITVEEFIKVMGCIHAFRDYAKRTSYQALGLPEKLPEMNANERCRLVAKKLWGEFNQRGENIIDVIKYLLYNGNDGLLPHRLFEISFSAERKLRFAGLSTYGEIIGWALPERFPPRNGRTSKALYALGYDVDHTE